MKWLFAAVFALACLAAPAAPAVAAPIETRVRLHDGKLATADLSRALLENFHLSGLELDAGEIDLTGVRGWTFVRALNTAMGAGCNVRVDADALVLSIDPEKLPHSVD